jgi:integrase
MSKRTHTFNWVLDPGKFLMKEEAKKLLETAKGRAQLAVTQGRKAPVRDYFIVDLAMSTGLRVMEMAHLTCGDIFIQDERFSLLV